MVTRAGETLLRLLLNVLRKATDSNYLPLSGFVPVQGPSAVEIAKLPRWEQRHANIGKSEGQVQVFQRDGKAIAAQWSAASSTWIEVGEVR